MYSPLLFPCPSKSKMHSDRSVREVYSDRYLASPENEESPCRYTTQADPVPSEIYVVSDLPDRTSRT
jgi:hypothetical protein